MATGLTEPTAFAVAVEMLVPVELIVTFAAPGSPPLRIAPSKCALVEPFAVAVALAEPLPKSSPPPVPCELAWARDAELELSVTLPVTLTTVPAPTAVSTVGAVRAVASPPEMPMPSEMLPMLWSASAPVGEAFSTAPNARLRPPNTLSLAPPNLNPRIPPSNIQLPLSQRSLEKYGVVSGRWKMYGDTL